jgi:AmmeMemoRadiSam system protein A
MMFEHDDCRRLLAIARSALEARVRREIDRTPEISGTLGTPRGAFVSIHHGDDLRGCLGRLEADWAVGRVVAHLGRAVADSDLRFPPVTVAEIPALTVEISILGPEREMRSPDDIEIGRHGLIVENGLRRGTLLPQVAAERQWDVATFLEQTCLKAGLSADAWTCGASVLLFDAQVFSEVRLTPHHIAGGV